MTNNLELTETPAPRYSQVKVYTFHSLPHVGISGERPWSLAHDRTYAAKPLGPFSFFEVVG